MALLVARDIEKAYGDRHVLRGCDLVVRPGDRIGLVGANGSGKSTLVRILAGAEEADHGTVERSGSMRLLSQDPVLPGVTVGDAADDAVGWHRALLADYQQALADGDMAGAAALQDRLDRDGWEVDHKVGAMLSMVGAPPPDARVDRLSGGEVRRVALARALLGMPDLLLLDEPTNHLDADTVEWLQAFLAGYRGAIVLVTHDRYLLEAVADRIVEVEDGRTVSYDDCSYADYLVARAERREQLLAEDDARRAMIRREAAWAARSPAARSTKQKARLQRLEALQEQEGVRPDQELNLDLRSGRRLGSTILEVHGLSKSYGDLVLARDLELALAPGDRIGIVGPNGSGKTTLLRMILGDEAPDRGEIVRGARVRVGVLDQHRTGLDDNATVWESAGDGNDHVRIGDRHVHVATFLERFLFTRGHFDQKVGKLSGGERARLLLAKLLLEGANLLLLDEPTNDLDLMTLRVLEEALLTFDGCAVVVTHDRAFLDRVCNGVLAFEGEGRVVRYADRQQYLRAREARRAAEEAARRVEEAARAAPITERAPEPARRRLSYAEKREFEALPARIEALEVEQGELEGILADPDTYRDRADDVPTLSSRLAELPTEIEALYERWSELEDRAGS